MFVGVVELMFGSRCRSPEEKEIDAQQEAAEKGNGRAQVNSGPEGPSLTVNVTPAQAMQGAAWAGKTAAANPEAAKAVAGAAGSSGGSNPFFGNQHRT